MNPDPQDRPIRGLADLGSDVSASFADFIWRKIHRRTTASQFASFSYKMPGAILLEFISIIVHLFTVVDGKKGKSQ
jgi:hypothetical protein